MTTSSRTGKKNCLSDRREKFSMFRVFAPLAGNSLALPSAKNALSRLVLKFPFDRIVPLEATGSHRSGRRQRIWCRRQVHRITAEVLEKQRTHEHARRGGTNPA